MSYRPSKKKSRFLKNQDKLFLLKSILQKNGSNDSLETLHEGRCAYVQRFTITGIWGNSRDPTMYPVLKLETPLFQN